MDDTISRQAAINAIVAKANEVFETKKKGATYPHDDFFQGMAYAENIIKNLSSAQPEIIRCKDCKYQDKNLRSVSVRWLPCMDVRTGSNWFCGSAERRTDE